MGRLFIITLIFALIPLTAGAEDVCKIRPDLCEGLTSSHSIREAAPVAHKRKHRRAPASARAASTDTDTAAVKDMKCRRPGDAYDTNSSYLPLCGRSGVSIADAPESSRQPASSSGPAISFTSYLKSNAADPVLSRRPAEQDAFVIPPRPAVFESPEAPAETTASSAASPAPIASAASTNAPVSSAATVPAAPNNAPSSAPPAFTFENASPNGFASH
jgi:hypothetical protein